MPHIAKNLITVVGSTAVGKTAACVQLAQSLNTVIVSADARQFYQNMAIGTAQPTAEERQAVPHYFVDFLPVQEVYNAGLFERDVLALLDQLFLQHEQVIMVGGSGLYLQAVCEGLSTMPPVDLQLREQLNGRLQREGIAALAEELAQIDPVYYRTVDLRNPRRVIRALEVCIATGKPYHAFRKKKVTQRPFNIIKVGLTRERAELYERIDKRVDYMWAQGLLAEATALYPYKICNALQTVGYREVFSYLEGGYSEEEMLQLLKRNTRRYAKRQMAWFGRDANIQWLHPDGRHALLTYVKGQMRMNSGTA
ncbi:MAG: tRNA (adenosine(37)-N6)-dimethylallyltransferase MiaA [Bacteroidota bacterium]